LQMAESIKIRHGSLCAPGNELIELPVIGDDTTTHEVSMEVIHNVIYARVEETLMILAQSLEKSGLKKHLGAGVILTGGFTKLEGLREIAVAIFDNMPVRLAKPTDTIGLFDTLRDPAYSCAVGLVKYASSGYAQYEIDVNKEMLYEKQNITPPIERPIMEVVNPQPEQEHTPPPMSKEPDPLSKFWQWVTNLF
jgi:cell division protein FtsA